MTKYTFDRLKDDSHLVTLVNKVYHDVEFSNYEDRHPEILSLERQRWIDDLQSFVFCHEGPRKGKKVVLDVGAGTGFVADCMENFLDQGDTMVFSDVSTKMLEVCRTKFANTVYEKEFVETDTTSFPVAAASVNLVTVNSVLHHIPDVQTLFNEIDRMLATNGYLVIKHEPNKLFASSFFLRNLYISLLSFRKSVHGIRRRLRGSVSNSATSKFYTEVVDELKKEGIDLDDNFKPRELSALVDIHSPTASGGIDPKRGFDPYAIVGDYFPDYQIVYIGTYGYFGKINEKGSWFRRFVGTILKFVFPRRGYFFDLIIKKV